MLSLLAALMFAAPASPLACPTVADDRVVAIELSLPSGESLTFAGSPRTFEALTLESAYRVSLPNGCRALAVDFGEDGEPREQFDTLTGWEVQADDSVRARLSELGLAIEPGSEPRNGRTLANVSYVDFAPAR